MLECVLNSNTSVHPPRRCSVCREVVGTESNGTKINAYFPSFISAIMTYWKCTISLDQKFTMTI